nr:hypothetical protein GCM10020063_064670 [Dactylosporangium thailandense]
MAGFEQQQGEQRPRLGTADRDGVAVVIEDFERPQDAKTHATFSNNPAAAPPPARSAPHGAPGHVTTRSGALRLSATSA